MSREQLLAEVQRRGLKIPQQTATPDRNALLAEAHLLAEAQRRGLKVPQKTATPEPLEVQQTDTPTQELPKMGIFNIPSNREEQLASRKKFSDIGNTFLENMRQRRDKIYESLDSGTKGGVKGDQSDIETVGQVFMQSVAGTGLDVLGQAGGELLEGAYRLLPDIVQKKVSGGAKDILDTSVGRAGLKALEKGGDIWEGFKQDNPRAARNVEAIALGVGGSLSVGGKSVIGTTKDVAGKGIAAAESVVKSLPEVVKKLPEIRKGNAILEPEDLKALSNQAYTAAAEAGENFPDAVRGELVESLRKNLPGEETLRKGTNDIQTALELMETRKGQPLTLQGAQQIDEELSQLISKNYKDGLNADGKKLLDIQDDFRTSIEKSD
jgi:prophage antirepressor-like protein